MNTPDFLMLPEAAALLRVGERTAYDLPRTYRVPGAKTRLDATVDRDLAKCARLGQPIFKRAFEGTLVPQEPADHPANRSPA